jgi:hypothetical protein
MKQLASEVGQTIRAALESWPSCVHAAPKIIFPDGSMRLEAWVLPGLRRVQDLRGLGRVLSIL